MQSVFRLIIDDTLLATHDAIRNFIAPVSRQAVHDDRVRCVLQQVLVYLVGQEDFPDISIALETENGKAYHQKTDIFNRLMWYSYDKESASEAACLAVETVKEIIELNKKGEKVKKLESFEYVKISPIIDYHNVADEESLKQIEDQPK